MYVAKAQQQCARPLLYKYMSERTTRANQCVIAQSRRQQKSGTLPTIGGEVTETERLRASFGFVPVRDICQRGCVQLRLRDSNASLRHTRLSIDESHLTHAVSCPLPHATSRLASASQCHNQFTASLEHCITHTTISQVTATARNTLHHPTWYSLLLA